MNFILVSTHGKPSVRKIGSLMSEEHRIVYTHQRIPIFHEDDVCIRWGCTTPLHFNGAKVINTSKAINLASNKAESRMLMQEKDVSVPRSFINIGDIRNDYFPIIARNSHHRKGQNFVVCKNYFDLRAFEQRNRNTNYYSKIIDKTNEYRVHVGHGKVLFIHEKPLLEGEIRGNQAITGLSWGRVIPWDDYRKPLCQLACDAVKCLGLDIGAVDIIKERTTGKFFVCEVNTAPTLCDSEYSSGRYAKYFDWIFRHPNEEWYDYTQWNAGKSFAFKNSQLSA